MIEIAGPNSIKNGDFTVMRGHSAEKFMCEFHSLEVVGERCAKFSIKGDRPTPCTKTPLRWWLEKRGRLRTGKTK